MQFFGRCGVPYCKLNWTGLNWPGLLGMALLSSLVGASFSGPAYCSGSATDCSAAPVVASQSAPEASKLYMSQDEAASS